MPEKKVLFHERQTFQPWVHGVALFLGIAGLILLLPSPNEDLSALRGTAGLACLAVGVVLLNQFLMSTWVYADRVRVQFGRLLPLHETVVRLGTAVDAEIVDLAGITEIGSGGYRKGTFRGREVWYLYARGQKAVLFTATETRIVLGTQYPQRLLAVLQQQPLSVVAPEAEID